MTTVPVAAIKCVCKLRPLPKTDAEMMVIRNVEILKWLTLSVIAPNPQAQANADMIAKKKLDEELGQFLSGLKLTVPFEPDSMGNSDLGEML